MEKEGPKDGEGTDITDYIIHNYEGIVSFINWNIYMTRGFIFMKLYVEKMNGCFFLFLGFHTLF